MLHPIMFNIISTKGDQLDGFTYLVACHGWYICYDFVFFIVVAIKYFLSLDATCRYGLLIPSVPSCFREIIAVCM